MNNTELQSTHHPNVMLKSFQHRMSERPCNPRNKYGSGSEINSGRRDNHRLIATWYKKAFTLAEVILTLGIIGIVAVYTIPPMVERAKNQAYSAQLKKFYTEFNEVLTRLTSEYGCVGDLSCTGLFSSTGSDAILGDAIVKYFKIYKNCDTAVAVDCFSANINSEYDGTSLVNFNPNADGYKFRIADGTSIYIKTAHNNCSTDYSTGALGNMSKFCGTVVVDLDGPTKGLNSFGIDVFWFWITNGKGPLLYPWGGADDNYAGINRWWKEPSSLAERYCYSNNKQGISCAGRIMEEDWQMTYN